ncbi:PREDICTED: collagen alpha-1(I) chain-like, partial [Capra hircus]|uniref:collagen alpha-1(I) chain-like n=1 Tax=Capra hircus TaxID=9925 RepID=UPI000846F2F6
MRPAAPGRRPGGGPPPAPPPAPPAHPRDPPPPPAARPEADGESGEGRREVLFNFPLRYLLTIGLVPVFSLRWSLPPALGCIPKQPDSGKTRARRAGGRYRPHTVHGLGLDQKDLGPHERRRGVASRRARGRGRGSPRGGAREGGDAEARGRPPRAPRFPAHTRHPDRPTPPRPDYPSPLREEEAAASAAAAAAGGGRRAEREGPRRGGEHEPAATGRTGRGTAERLDAGERVGARAGAEARTGDGRTARPLSPPAPATAPPSRRELRGANRGTAAARGESAQRRADAAASRGSPPRHASPGRGRARGPASGANRPPRRGESRGGRGREAGTGRGRTAAGGGTAGVGERGAPAGRTGRRDPHPRHPPRGPRHPVARDRPRPPTPPPTAATPRGRLRREEALPGGGETDPRRPGGPGASGDGGPGGPCEDSPQPRTPEGRLIGKRRSDRRSPGRNPGPQSYELRRAFRFGGRPAAGTAHVPPPPAPSRRRELGRRGLPPAGRVRRKAAHRRGRERFHTTGHPAPTRQGGCGHPTGARGVPALPRGRGRGARTRRTRPRPTRRPPGSPLPTAAAAVTAARHAARHPGPSGDGGVRGRREGPPDSPRARPPRPQGGRATPPGVFKPPRRDALGTWEGGGGRGARRAPAPTRTTDRRVPARGRARARASALPARDTRGPPPRAGRPPPGGPRRAPDSRPHPSPRDGQSPFPTAAPSHAVPYGPGSAGPPPASLPQPPGWGGPLPAPALPGTLPPTTTTEGRGQGAGAPTGSLAPSGRGGRREGGRTRTETHEPPGGVGGWGRGRDRAPRPGGARGGARRPRDGPRAAGRPTTTGRGRPAQGRRRGRRRGGASGPATGKPPPVPPHSPRDATGGPAPRGVRGRERRSWPAPRAVGWGEAHGAPPRTLGPTSRDVREGRAGRGTHAGGGDAAAAGREARRRAPPSPDASPFPPALPHPAPHGGGGGRRGSRAGRRRSRHATSIVKFDRLSQRSARAVGRPRRGRSEGLTKPSNRFSFATILPPEPKDFGFPEAARRVMGITPPHRQSASFMVGTTT